MRHLLWPIAALILASPSGKLMMVLHSPNGPAAQPHVFEMEDTGETLRVVKEFTGSTE